MTASASPLSMLDTSTATNAMRATPKTAPKGASRAEIGEAAKKFEGMFLSQMFQCMFEGVNADPEFGGGQAEDMYKSMMIDEYSKQVVKKGGLGIADHVARTMLAAQEGRA